MGLVNSIKKSHEEVSSIEDKIPQPITTPPYVMREELGGLCYSACPPTYQVPLLRCPDGYRRTAVCTCDDMYCSDRPKRSSFSFNTAELSSTIRNKREEIRKLFHEGSREGEDEDEEDDSENDNAEENCSDEQSEDEPITRKKHIKVPEMSNENNTNNKFSECVVCFDNVGDIVLNCGHMGFCACCIEKIVRPFNEDNSVKHPQCPICQTKIKTVTRVFMSN